jgi:formate-dependent nitrite reductase membrane component NrfD
MKKGILLVALLANIVALFCIFNPWFEDWMSQGIVFLVLEAVFLVLIGVPVFVHHLRKGLSAREALAASMDSVMSFLAGWV